MNLAECQAVKEQIPIANLAWLHFVLASLSSLVFAVEVEGGRDAGAGADAGCSAQVLESRRTVWGKLLFLPSFFPKYTYKKVSVYVQLYKLVFIQHFSNSKLV